MAICVAPLVGAWIEMQVCGNVKRIQVVAPLVGAWIEMLTIRTWCLAKWSLLSWERGLKW